MTTNTCKSCGADVSPSMKFCASCGLKTKLASKLFTKKRIIIAIITAVLIPIIVLTNIYAPAKRVNGDEYNMLPEASELEISSEHEKQLYDLELADYIRMQLLQIPKVHNALVIVNTNELNPISIQTDVSKATVIIQVVLGDDETLSDEETQAIIDLVMYKVSGVELDGIFIEEVSNLAR